MKEILMREHFGAFLADGDLGNRFRFSHLDPLLNASEVFVIDFDGVTNMSESFTNACFGNLAEDHPQDILEKVRFRGCLAGIRDSLAASISSGCSRGLRLVR